MLAHFFKKVKSLLWILKKDFKKFRLVENEERRALHRTKVLKCLKASPGAAGSLEKPLYIEQKYFGSYFSALKCESGNQSLILKPYSPL